MCCVNGRVTSWVELERGAGRRGVPGNQYPGLLPTRSVGVSAGRLSFLIVRLFGRDGLLLDCVSSIGLGLFLRGLFIHGLRGSVTHNGYLSVCWFTGSRHDSFRRKYPTLRRTRTSVKKNTF
jgi:hypothetical protein